MGIKGILACLILLAFFVSCAPGVYVPGKLKKFELGQIVDTGTLDAVSFEQMADALAQKRVVFLGEVHMSSADHKMQLDVIKSLWERDPNLAIGLEMLPWEAQPSLDGYLDRRLSEKDFIEESGWRKAWGFPFSLYKPIFEFAREKGINLVALNAPGRVVKKVARKGLAGLTREERSLIAREIDLGDAAHRDWVSKVFETHDEVGGFEEFYQAQCVWEETMAENAARFLESPEGMDKKMAVLAGKGHLNFGFGIPKRLFRRTKAPYGIALPAVASGWSETLEEGIADYLWVRKAGEHPHRAFLGVRLKESEEGVEVLGVMPGSRAEKAGVEKGDRIIAIDGHEIRSLMEAHEAAANLREKALEIELMRKEERIRKVVEP